MIKLPEFDAFIFDMDGVLIDSENFYSEMERENFRKLGLNIPHEEHITYQGTATDEMWKKIKERHPLPYSVEELVEMTNDLTIPVFRNMDRIDPMPGVEELIIRLSEKNIPLAVASSSFPEAIRIILEKTGLEKYFGVVVNSRMTGKSKPAPDIFLLAASKLGVAPERCIVIEDSTNGITAAKRAGMFCIAYNGPGSEHQDQSGADLIIDNYGDLAGIL
ncbi:MAG: HAD family hydrolase [Bacteroidota bacterium]